MKKITDKERLDWLAQQGIETCVRVEGRAGNSGMKGWDKAGKSYAVHAPLGMSLRRAIDAAIRASQPNKVRG